MVRGGDLVPSMSDCKTDNAYVHMVAPTGDKASLKAAQALLLEHLATVKAVPGVKSVQRIICGGWCALRLCRLNRDRPDLCVWLVATTSRSSPRSTQVRTVPGRPQATRRKRRF